MARSTCGSGAHHQEIHMAEKPVASLLFNILITRYLTPETHFNILTRNGHYAEPEPAHNLAGDWAVTVMPAPEHFDLDNFTDF
jgi:hypothetical protein